MLRTRSGVLEAGAPAQALGELRASRSRPAVGTLEAADLCLGLLDVAEVGEEQALVAGRRAQAPFVPGEAGQPAHVQQVGDEQRVELALRSRARQPSPAPRRRSASRSSCPGLSASREPRGTRRRPCPETLPMQRSRITERRRHSSRSSTRRGGPRPPAGPRPRARRGSRRSSGSRRPGSGSARPRVSPARWSSSQYSPSWLVWENATSSPISRANCATCDLQLGERELP